MASLEHEKRALRSEAGSSEATEPLLCGAILCSCCLYVLVIAGVRVELKTPGRRPLSLDFSWSTGPHAPELGPGNREFRATLPHTTFLRTDRNCAEAFVCSAEYVLPSSRLLSLACMV